MNIPFIPAKFNANKAIGLMIKKAMMVFLYQAGESPKNILYKLSIMLKTK